MGVIRPGDTLTARCVYSNPTDSVIKIGPTADDEMCNFYIMYYTENDEEEEEEGISQPDYPGEESSDECFSSGQYTWWDYQEVLGNVPQWVDELSLGFASTITKQSQIRTESFLESIKFLEKKQHADYC